MGKFYTETLQKGSKGDATKEWQNFLKSQGYTLDVDGDFGDMTHAATIDWQGKNGLGVDGIVGKNTWGKAGYSDINNAVSAPTFGTAPTKPTFNSTAFADTDEGTAKGTAKNNAENAVANYGDFTWDKESLSNEVWDKIFNREKFSYDVNSDAIYQQYKDKYITQGKMAMADTMGQAAAMTGGYGNSYAATAGNQAYQSHLQQLNDIVPELYQMAYDRYNQEGQELYNQYGMLMDDHDRKYGMWSDGYNRAIAERDYTNSDYYNAATLYGTEVDRGNSLAQQGYTNEFNAWSEANTNAWKQAEWDEAARRYAIDQAWKQKEWDESQRRYEESKVTSSGGSGGGNGSGGSGGGNGGGGTADTLWYATGTYDDNGNPVFRNSEGKTQGFGAGVNPYTGTKHPDAKHGTFSNGYQPNNIGGTKLKNSGMSTSITGKNQTIWEANGKYWLWRGDLNKYIEVDVSDLD